jgi:hypothetical protein
VLYRVKRTELELADLRKRGQLISERLDGDAFASIRNEPSDNGQQPSPLTEDGATVIEAEPNSAGGG